MINRRRITNLAGDNLKRTEILDYMQRNFPKYAWMEPLNVSDIMSSTIRIRMY